MGQEGGHQIHSLPVKRCGGRELKGDRSGHVVDRPGPEGGCREGKMEEWDLVEEFFSLI